MKPSTKIATLTILLTLASSASAEFAGHPDMSSFHRQSPSWFLAGFGTHSGGASGSVLSDPENQLAFQYSLPVPLLTEKTSHTGIYAQFSQRSFWFPYERERTALDNTFTPEIFGSLDRRTLAGGEASWRIPSLRAGYVHQSNGLGSTESRTWNRWLMQAEFGDASLDPFQLRVAAWVIFNEFDNPDIRQHLGDGRIALLWQPLHANGNGAEVFGVQAESGWGVKGRGVKYLEMAIYAHPELLSPRLSWMPSFMLRYFTGRGESLSRYNRDTHSIRIGLVLFK